jgi:hypothetical protein
LTSEWNSQKALATLLCTVAWDSPTKKQKKFTKKGWKADFSTYRFHYFGSCIDMSFTSKLSFSNTQSFGRPISPFEEIDARLNRTFPYFTMYMSLTERKPVVITAGKTVVRGLRKNLHVISVEVPEIYTV